MNHELTEYELNELKHEIGVRLWIVLSGVYLVAALAYLAILDDLVLQVLAFVPVLLSLTAALLEKRVLAKKQQLALLEE